MIIIELSRKLYLKIKETKYKATRLKHILLGAKLGRDVRISKNVKLSYPSNIRIGEGTWVGEGSIISARKGVKVGRCCQIAPYCAIYDNDHSMPLFSKKKNKSNNVVIGNYTWMGCHSIILKGVKVGKNVTIGAGSVVTKDVSDNSIVAGSPAKKIGENPSS